MCSVNGDFFDYSEKMRTIQYDYIAQIKDPSNTEFAFLLAEDLKQAIRDSHCEGGRRLKQQERQLEGGTLIGFQVLEPTVKGKFENPVKSFFCLNCVRIVLSH